MTPEVVSLVVVALIASVAALLIRLKQSRDKQFKLQKEKDVATIKENAKSDIQATDLQHLVDKLNRRLAADRRKPPTH